VRDNRAQAFTWYGCPARWV